MVNCLIFSTAKQIGHLFLRFFWLGLWMFALGLLVWFPLRWWPGDRLWPVRLVNYLMPWLLVGLAPGLLAAALARRKWLAAALAVPTVLIGVTFSPLFLPRSSLALAGSQSFKVMSYNIWWHNPYNGEATALIKKVEPDILLLQEITPTAFYELRNELIDLYPEDELHTAYGPGIGQAIISRFPLRPIEAGSFKDRTQKVIIETPAGPVAVWNTHASQPFPWSRQYRQMTFLVEDMATVEIPLIVGGDFNTTDQSETYQLLDRSLDNAHWQAGWGFGFTFPAHSPRVKGVPLLTSLIRIDHIFYSDHFFAHSARTLPESGGSDHFPVVAELSLR